MRSKREHFNRILLECQLCGKGLKEGLRAPSGEYTCAKGGRHARVLGSAAVFLATPKTGSTASPWRWNRWRRFPSSGPPVLKHTTVQRFHRFVGPYLRAASGAEFTTVALMREPLDWLGSWYRFASATIWPTARTYPQHDL
jgi:hypothetical protein